jgi:hypothetical protein
MTTEEMLVLRTLEHNVDRMLAQMERIERRILDFCERPNERSPLQSFQHFPVSNRRLDEGNTTTE